MQLINTADKCVTYHADDTRDDPDNNCKTRRTSKEQNPFWTDKDPAADDDPYDDPHPVEQAQLPLQLGPTIVIVVALQHLWRLLHLLGPTFPFLPLTSMSHLDPLNEPQGKGHSTA